MMAAIKSLKNNRSLMSKRKEKKALSGSYAKLKLKDFPKNATPETLALIREKIKSDNRRTILKVVVIFVLILLSLVFMYNF